MAVDVAMELAVMQSVGNALAQLPDAEARLRVLGWAADRVRVARERTEALDASRRLQPAADPVVSIDGLTDQFPSLAVHIRETADRDGLDLGPFDGSGPQMSESLAAQIRGLAADLGQFAIDWRHA
jgi:hypothetical protein